MFDGSNDNGFDFSAPLETVFFLIRLTSSELRMDQLSPHCFSCQLARHSLSTVTAVLVPAICISVFLWKLFENFDKRWHSILCLLHKHEQISTIVVNVLFVHLDVQEAAGKCQESFVMIGSGEAS